MSKDLVCHKTRKNNRRTRRTQNHDAIRSCNNFSVIKLTANSTSRHTGQDLDKIGKHVVANNLSKIQTTIRVIDMTTTTSLANVKMEASFILDCVTQLQQKIKFAENLWYINVKSLKLDYLESIKNNIAIKNNNFWRIQRCEITKSQFTPVKMLGSGSYGCVYLVQHAITKKQYALKCISLKKQHVADTLKEVDVLKRFKSVFSVKLYQTFFDVCDQHHCLLLEYVDGLTLTKFVSRMFPYDKKQRKAYHDMIFIYSAELVCAVGHLHQELGIPHKDLKGNNVMIDKRGHLKIIDFGYSGETEWWRGVFSHKYLDSRLRESQIAGDNDDSETFSLACGTVCYSPPEVAIYKNQSKVDALKRFSKYQTFQADCWAIGCLIYFMHFGYHPISKHFGVTNKELTRQMVIEYAACYFEPPATLSVDYIQRNGGNFALSNLLFNTLCSANIRYGAKDIGAMEILSNPFFARVNMDKIMQSNGPYNLTTSSNASCNNSQNIIFTFPQISDSDRSDALPYFNWSIVDDSE